MRRNVKRLLNNLYDDLSYNVKLIDRYIELHGFAISVGDDATAKFYNTQVTYLYERNKQIITTINEIEKRVS